jgi:hypothetical protein
VVLGVTLITTPNSLLAWFGFATTTEPWIRIVGMLLLVLAFYCWRAAVEHVGRFIVWSVWARGAVPVVFTAYVLLGWAERTLLLLGLVDLAGACWTALALRSESRQGARLR